MGEPVESRGVSRRAQLIFFAIGAIALTALIIRSDPRQLARDIGNAGWAVPAIAGVYGIVYTFNTAAWRLTMIEPPRLSFARAWIVNVAAFSINYLTPFASIGGEPFKIVAASQWMGARNGAASVLNYRLVHMQAHLLVFLTGVALAFFFLPPGTIATPLLLFLAVVLVALTALLLAIHREGVIERLFDLASKLPFIGRFMLGLEPRREGLIEVDRQLIAFHRSSPARYYGALFLEYVARVISMFEFFIIARAVGHPVSFGSAFLIGGFSSLVVNLFFFMPFNVGSKEGGLYIIFAALGIPSRLGVAAAVVSRLREIIWIAIGLLLVLLTRRNREPDHPRAALAVHGPP
jgi:uncharacterized protein (TIRG00374 family)